MCIARLRRAPNALMSLVLREETSLRGGLKGVRTAVYIVAFQFSGYQIVL